jgi:hypothetical protein
LIDYAGMYPPESLALEEAVARYHSHHAGPFEFILGVFLCPTSQLGALEAVLDGDRISVGTVLDLPLGEAIAAIADSRLDIGQIEARDPELGDRLDELPPSASLWLEAASTRVLDTIPEGGNPRIGLKVRCGGASAEDFPSPATLSGVLETAFAAGLPLKATAGLHHPWRHLWPELGVWRHGFLNLLAAAAILVEGGDRDDAETMLSATGGRFDGTMLQVEHREFDSNALAEARRFFRSYGSCSLSEPIDDLVAMGAL